MLARKRNIFSRPARCVARSLSQQKSSKDLIYWSLKDTTAIPLNRAFFKDFLKRDLSVSYCIRGG
jgi:hypothetical protein